MNGPYALRSKSILEDRLDRARRVDDLRSDHLRPEVEVESRIGLVGWQVADQQHERPVEQGPLEDRRRVIGDQDVGGSEELVHLGRRVDHDVEPRDRHPRGVHVGVGLQDDGVIRRQSLAKRHRIELHCRSPVTAAASERGSEGHDRSTAQSGVGGEDAFSSCCQRHWVMEEVGARRTERQHPFDGGAQGGSPRLSTCLA